MKPKIKVTMPSSNKGGLLTRVKDKGLEVMESALNGAGPLAGKLGRLTQRAVGFPFKTTFKILEILYVYAREFFYIRSGIKFEPSSKKFWAQLAHVAFFVGVYLRFFGSEAVAARVDGTIIGILAGHAVAAMGWYAVGKQKDIDNSAKNNVLTSNVPTGTIKATPEQEAAALETPKK